MTVDGTVVGMVVGSRFGLTLGIGQVEVYASAAARAAVLEAERLAQVAAGYPDEAIHRPTRLSELLVDHADRAGIHAVLRDVAEAQAELHALQAAAITRLAALQPGTTALPGAADHADDRPADDRAADDWVADEVAVVLGIATSSAATLVGKQRALVDQLPQVWAALAEGRIDVRRATVLVDTLAHRKHSAGGALPDDVVDHAAHQGLAWIAEGIGPTPLADRVAGVLIAADPAEAERRAERRRAKQNTTTVGTGDGLATFRSDHLDADHAAQMQTVIDAMAATMKRNGDRRPIGVLRTHAHHQLITRPWQALPDDVAAARWNLNLRADLADLDHEGPLGTAPTPTAASSEDPGTRDPDDPDDPDDLRVCGSGVGAIGGLPVSPVAVADLLARVDALLRTGTPGRTGGGQLTGNVWFQIVDATGRLRALTTLTEARAALRRGTGLGPPPAIDRYTPTPAQIRFIKARDQHCRFPGCHRPAEYADLDHVIPYDHHDPHHGGPTCITNLVCLCRHHHRLKTHAEGWHFAMDPDGTLHVTPPGGPTRTTRPTTLAEAHVGTEVDHVIELLGPIPKRYRTPTPAERATRRAAAAERARLAAQIDADLDAALARAAAGLPLWPTTDAPDDDQDPPPF
ncbi:DUF222 domain-containing protein [Klenkia sp. LSe6-5]|uniref:DUF222 domain-containing protein n=1 Tax=Klenkia sesuvii TaxID=3103137 RepID=A0ABU8DNH3_9ACTN